MARTPQRREKRYAPIGAYLAAQPRSTNEVTLTFDEVAKIVGRKLPPTAFKERSWWANQQYGSRAYHWQDVGWQTGHVDMKRHIVPFIRVRGGAALRPLRPLTLQEVVTEVNEAAQNRLIGGLPEWRKKRYGLARTGASTLFYAEVEKERDWVFHVGGLSELQFNLGFEEPDDIRTFRHGVAFSLQPTREMPDIEPLLPKIERFNEYLRIYPNAFEGFSMWHWRGGRSSTYAVSPIPDELCRRDTFIFIGAQQPADRISIDWILDDFDRLLPLYEYVEGTAAFPVVTRERERERERKGFEFIPGNKAKVTRTSFERVAATIDKALRHNALQAALFAHLEEVHGKKNTSGEQDCGNRTLIDVCVREKDGYVYYELKTGLSAQSCVREALGQLMEYSYWPGAQEAKRLVIVGEAPYDDAAKAYIKKLRKKFSLPLEYRQFDAKSGKLA